jgi:hypothetical protein
MVSRKFGNTLKAVTQIDEMRQGHDWAQLGTLNLYNPDQIKSHRIRMKTGTK